MYVHYKLHGSRIIVPKRPRRSTLIQVLYCGTDCSTLTLLVYGAPFRLFSGRLRRRTMCRTSPKITGCFSLYESLYTFFLVLKEFVLKVIRAIGLTIIGITFLRAGIRRIHACF